MQLDFEKPTRKAERRRRLKKYQVDSDDNDDDTPIVKPVAKRSAPSIFDSGSDEEDNVPISVVFGKKDNANVTEETIPQNGQADDVTKKMSIDVKKRKGSAISEDPASSMYISCSYLACMYFSYLLPTDL